MCSLSEWVKIQYVSWVLKTYVYLSFGEDRKNDENSAMPAK